MPTQFVPSLRDSETVICRRCNTRQYPRNGTCVRCHCALGLDYLNLQVSTRLNPRTVHDERQLARSLGILLRSLRKRRGLSQSQLAMRAAGCIARNLPVQSGMRPCAPSPRQTLSDRQSIGINRSDPALREDGVARRSSIKRPPLNQAAFHSTCS